MTPQKEGHHDQPEVERPDIDAASSILSPDSKRLQELAFDPASTLANDAVNQPSKLLVRPFSSGKGLQNITHYQMAAANLRPVVLARPLISNLPIYTTTTSTAQSGDSSQLFSRSIPPKMSISSLSSNRTGESCKFSKSLDTIERPKSCVKEPATVSDQNVIDGKNDTEDQLQDVREVSTASQNEAEVVTATPEMQDDMQQTFTFAPPGADRFLSTKTTRNTCVVRDGVSDLVHALEDTNANPIQTEGVVRYIDNVPHDSILASTENHYINSNQVQLDQDANQQSPPRKFNIGPVPQPQSLQDAPKFPHHRPIVGSRVEKRPPLRLRAPKTVYSHQTPQVAASTLLPTTEDLMMILMRRQRLSKSRERELDEVQQKLQSHIDHLRTENRECCEQMAVTKSEFEQQNVEINAYKTQIDDFKCRFLKFKAYARSLAEDQATMSQTMKDIKNTAKSLLQEKDDLNLNLGSLKNTLALSENMVCKIRSTLADVSGRVQPLEYDVHVMQEKLKMNEDRLWHENTRNNRLEAQILNAQHVQGKLSLISAEEYRRAAAYLDDLNQTTLILSKIFLKKQQVKDTPGILQCINLLQALTESIDGEGTTLTQLKALMNTILGRLQYYNTTVQGAAKAVAVDRGKLAQEVLDQVASSISSIGPLIGTEIEYVRLHERVSQLQNNLASREQALSLAIEEKAASEQREKEQSQRVDKLIEQCAEAKRHGPLRDPVPAPRLSFDIDLLLTKSMQANKKAADKEQEVTVLQTRLRELQIEYADLEAKHQNLQADNNAALQHETATQGQVNNVNIGLNPAAEIADLTQDATVRNGVINQLQLASVSFPNLFQGADTRDAEIEELRFEANKVPALIQDITTRDSEISKLQAEVLQLPNLVQKLTTRNEELIKARHQASKVLDLKQQLNDQSEELFQLRLDSSRITDLSASVIEKDVKIKQLESQAFEWSGLATQITEQEMTIVDLQKKVSEKATALLSREAELAELRPKVAQAEANASDNLALKLDVKQYETTVLNLQKNVDDLESEVAKYRETIQSQQNELQELQKYLRDQRSASLLQTSQFADLQCELKNACDLANQVPILQQENLEAKKALCDARKHIAQIEELQDQQAKLLVDKQELTALSKSRTQNTCEPPITAQKPSGILSSSSPANLNDTESSPAILDSASLHVSRARTSPPISNRDERIDETTLMTMNEINGSPQISDSQPQVQNPGGAVRCSPPTRNAQATNSLKYRSSKRKKNSSIREPTNLSGGDKMLLEDYEVPESIHKNMDVTTGKVRMWHIQERPAKSPSYGNEARRTDITSSGQRRSRTNRLISTTAETPPPENSPSTPKAADSSSPGVTRHLPNSAVKRPRIETAENSSIEESGSKRFRRNLTNLDAGKTSNRPTFSEAQASKTKSTNRSQTELPEASRSGSVNGTQTLSKASGNRKPSRKSSRLHRYTERFNPQ